MLSHRVGICISYPMAEQQVEWLIVVSRLTKLSQKLINCRNKCNQSQSHQSRAFIFISDAGFSQSTPIHWRPTRGGNQDDNGILNYIFYRKVARTTKLNLLDWKTLEGD